MERRKFLKAMGGGLVLVATAGCASFGIANAGESVSETFEDYEAFRQYQDIKTQPELTKEQEELLSQFKESDGELAKNYSWLNPNNLSDRDKIFLKQQEKYN